MTHLHLPRGCHLEDVTRCSKTSCCGPASSHRVAQRCPSDGNWVAWMAQAAPDPHPSAPRGWPLPPRLPCFGQCVFIPSESSCREFPFRFTTLPRLFFLTPTAKRNGSSSFWGGVGIKPYKLFLRHWEPSWPSAYHPRQRMETHQSILHIFKENASSNQFFDDFNFPPLSLQWNHNSLYVEEKYPGFVNRNTAELLPEEQKTAWQSDARGKDFAL